MMRSITSTAPANRSKTCLRGAGGAITHPLAPATHTLSLHDALPIWQFLLNDQHRRRCRQTEQEQERSDQVSERGPFVLKDQRRRRWHQNGARAELGKAVAVLRRRGCCRRRPPSSQRPVDLVDLDDAVDHLHGASESVKNLSARRRWCHHTPARPRHPHTIPTRRSSDLAISAERSAPETLPPNGARARAERSSE